MRFLPSLGEERLLATQSLLRSARRRGLLREAEGANAQVSLVIDWKSPGAFVRLVLFAVTMVLLFLFLRLLAEAGSEFKGVITCAVALIVAEVLILKYRFFRGGIDEALYLGGLLAFVISLPGEPRIEAWLLVAAAFLIAGLRLLQPLFLAAVPLLLVYYLSEALTMSAAAGWTAVAFAASAGSLLIARSLPPFLEKTFSILIVVLPLLAHIAFQGASLNAIQHTAICVLIAAVLWWSALRWRSAAMLWSALLMIAIASVHLGDHTRLAAEWKLILAGCAAVAISTFLDRRLRSRGTGITTARDSEEPPAMIESIVSAGALSSPVDSGSARGAGGSFGGGGASGGY